MLQGIILRILPTQEADAILSLLVKNTGKISAYAFSYKKSRRSFPNSLQLFHVYDFDLVPNTKGLTTLRAAQSVHSFTKLTEKLEVFAAASCALESIDATLQEHLAADALLDQTYTFLETLEQNPDMPDQVLRLCLRWMELQILDHLGALPNLDFCAECAQPISVAAEYLPSKGFICETCTSSCINGIPVPTHSILLFKKLLLQPLNLTFKNTQPHWNKLTSFNPTLELLTPIIRSSIQEHSSKKILKAHEFFRQLLPNEDKNMIL